MTMVKTQFFWLSSHKKFYLQNTSLLWVVSVQYRPVHNRPLITEHLKQTTFVTDQFIIDHVHNRPRSITDQFILDHIYNRPVHIRSHL